MRHNLWDILPGWGRRSGLRQLNSGEISRKVGAYRLREWFFRHALALPAFYIFFIYQGKLCLFFNNFFPWENVFSFMTRDYDSLLLSICTTFIQFTHIFWRFNKNFLDIFFSKWYIVFINWKNLRVLTERVECKPRGVGGLWEPTVWAVFEIFRYWPFFITFRAEIRNTRQTGQYFFQLIIVADRGVNSNRSFSCYAETKLPETVQDVA